MTRRPEGTEPRQPVLLTTTELRARLREAAGRLGGIAKWAAAHQVPATLVYAFLNHPGSAPPSIVAALGYQRVVRYQRRAPEASCR